MTLIADVFRKLRTPKNKVRAMREKSCFRVSLKKEHGKGAQILFKFEGQHLYHIKRSLASQLSYKDSLLVIGKISKLFPNTLSAYGKYSLLIETIQRNEFRWNYLEKKNTFFSIFFFIFEI